MPAKAPEADKAARKGSAPAQALPKEPEQEPDQGLTQDFGQESDYDADSGIHLTMNISELSPFTSLILYCCSTC